MSGGLFRTGKKCFSGDRSFIIPNEADREYRSINRFCSATRLGDRGLRIVFSRDFKITPTTYLPETTNSEGFAKTAKMTVCFPKLQTKFILSVSLQRKRHKDWRLPAVSARTILYDTV